MPDRINPLDIVHSDELPAVCKSFLTIDVPEVRTNSWTTLWGRTCIRTRFVLDGLCKSYF